MTNEMFGVHYFDSKESAVFESKTDQLYFFRSYIGYHEIQVEKGDSIYYLDDELNAAIVCKGPCHIVSHHLATIIRGYMHPNAVSFLEGVTTLPYINGCSTKQLFPPIRIGDPTLQYLKIPAYSEEQNHHIHSTFRVVYILSGNGKSIVGLKNHHISTDLYPGKVIILEPMAPHHFETHNETGLIAIPLHIFSSAGPMERNHPMFNGTINI